MKAADTRTACDGRSRRLTLRSLKRRILGRNTMTKLRILTRGLEYRHILGYAEIDGWLAPEEATRLYDLACSLPDNGAVVVEIGSWLGKSSLVLAKGLAGKKNARLYCIDPFNADGDMASRNEYARRQECLRGTLQEEFIQNMRCHGIDGIVRPLVGYSRDFAPTFRRAVDLLFIDGNHNYKAVAQDFDDWARWVRPGGIVALHDVTPGGIQTGPRRVVTERIEGNPLWDPVGHWAGLYAARRRAPVGTAVPASIRRNQKLEQHPCHYE